MIIFKITKAILTNPRIYRSFSFRSVVFTVLAVFTFRARARQYRNEIVASSASEKKYFFNWKRDEKQYLS